MKYIVVYREESQMSDKTKYWHINSDDDVDGIRAFCEKVFNKPSQYRRTIKAIYQCVYIPEQEAAE